MKMPDLNGKKALAIVSTLVAFIFTLLTYTVTITLAYASVKEDVAVIRVRQEERHEMLKTIQVEIGQQRTEIADIRSRLMQIWAAQSPSREN